MDFIDAVAILILGAAAVTAAVFVKHRSILGMVVWLSFGAALTAEGLGNLMGWIPPR